MNDLLPTGILKSWSVTFKPLDIDTRVSDPADWIVQWDNVALKQALIDSYVLRSDLMQAFEVLLLGKMHVFDVTNHVVDVQVTRLNNSRYKVRKAMPAKLAVLDDKCVAELIEVDVSISGSSGTDALFGLRDFIEHLMDKAADGTLAGPAMAQILRYLESHVQDEHRQDFANGSESDSNKA